MELAEEVFGGDALVVPYARPGLALARVCAERLADAAGGDGVAGLVLARHGLVTFADDAREAYECHLALVARALARVEAASARAASFPPAGLMPPGFGAREGGDDSAFGTGDPGPPRRVVPGELGGLATLRRDLSAAAGRPLVLHRWRGDRARRFAARPDLARVSQSGPASPHHVLRTKRVPLLGRDAARYAAAYRGYVEHHRGDRELVARDPAPRVVIDPELGVVAAGERPADAAAAAEVYAHTAWVIEHAEALGGYAPVTEAEAFAVEYGPPVQAEPVPAPFTGRVALVTGAASGIGRACTTALLDAGAAVVGLDLDAAVDGVAAGPAYRAVTGDAADAAAVEQAVGAAVDGYGGLDVLVLGAGVVPPSPPTELDPLPWERAVTANAGAAALALRAAHPYLAVSPVGGSVAVVAPASAPMAAVTQLARVAALEWAGDGIRVNVVHPDGVSGNGAEGACRHVAAAVVALCGDGFARTTGAEVTVDGGDRVT